VVRFGNEKNKNYHHSRFSDVFNSIIQTYELREIPVVDIHGQIIMSLLLWKSWIES
jgi:hypothetical protein